MIRPPFVARVAAGLAVTALEEARNALEEARKIPGVAVTLPMTAVSQVLQTGMRLQQSITSLAIKGDQAFALLPWQGEEAQPAWAVFDEDTDTAATDTAAAGGSGRFALYSVDPTDGARSQAESAAPHADVAVDEPDIVTALDYPNLTLAQLRARIRTLGIDDLTAVLDYENATRSRAPFQTMLSNRITTAKAK
ncbi:hypothetical protein ABH922_000877 [Rhodococcus sp. 27YEA15]|uniref:lipid droplet-associated protein n=1 Tax=Rhodococcus sp. 27YEA15 TaxID=3156259 RepID=UPI003C7C5636